MFKTNCFGELASTVCFDLLIGGTVSGSWVQTTTAYIVRVTLCTINKYSG